MYAAIRQGKSKDWPWPKSWHAGLRRVPFRSSVMSKGFMAYYVVYAPDDTVTAISIFNNHAGGGGSRTDAGSRGSNRTLRLC